MKLISAALGVVGHDGGISRIGENIGRKGGRWMRLVNTVLK